MRNPIPCGGQAVLGFYVFSVFSVGLPNLSKRLHVTRIGAGDKPNARSLVYQTYNRPDLRNKRSPLEPSRPPRTSIRR
ncbi:hypothetical protein MPL3356_250005 [Mesorhizobium plurifarium]|uniref:Uncharacterized protein n=1 Tax=Mesorhizobium plurifarium TaxID=69974 RepID=A0A090DU76_MESPL|nr:hypothetical protein MPL3356_250005 [Mesorhizobium plurifarium]